LLFPGWTPQVVLEMKAHLFFKMLVKGRMLERQKRHQHYQDLCMVAAYPTYTPESQTEVRQYFHDNALTHRQLRDREKHRLEMEQKAQENYRSTSAGLDFFKQTRSKNVG
jgi:hypothetical protein